MEKNITSDLGITMSIQAQLVKNKIIMNKLIVYILCLVFLACNSTPESLEEYHTWAQKNRSLRVIHQASEDYLFELEYRPHSLLIAQELGDDAAPTTIENKYDQVKDLQYFNLFVSPIQAKGMSTVSSENKHDLSALGSYLSYGMQDDLILVEGRDSFECVLYHFESFADLNQKNNIVLAFESNDVENKKEKTVILKHGYLNNQPLSFNFNKETLNQIPLLSWKK